MKPDIFDKIRIACGKVAGRARGVRIVHERIADYARSLPLETARNPELDTTRHFTGSAADTVAFFLTLDTINFGSGYFPRLRKLAGCSGYFTMATHLTRRFHAAGPIPADQLAAMTPADCARLFDQDPENPPAFELMNLFARALNDLGHCLMADFDGHFTRMVAAAGGSAGRLVEILGRMPFFRDVATYDGMAVPLYKRAQLTAADLSIALSGRGLGRFEDLDRLTIFADNLVPHVLRMDGVLRYAPELLGRIHAGELIRAGSSEEIEIRACALHAAELIRESLAADGQEVTSQGLDYALWNRGQGADYKAVARHRCRSVFY